jgi:hypothetical protein
VATNLERIKMKIKESKLREMIQKVLREVTTSTAAKGHHKSPDTARTTSKSASADAASAEYTKAKSSYVDALSNWQKHATKEPVIDKKTNPAGPGAVQGKSAQFITTHSKSGQSYYHNSPAGAVPKGYPSWKINPAYASWDVIRGDLETTKDSAAADQTQANDAWSQARADVETSKTSDRETYGKSPASTPSFQTKGSGTSRSRGAKGKASKSTGKKGKKGKKEESLINKNNIINERAKPSRSTVKEIKNWMKSLEENRYRKLVHADARRVGWFVNNNLAEDYESMPISMKKKWSKAAYGRERYLAKEFMKHKKSEQKLRESIRKIIKRLI